jgi:hypothetical protein
VTSLTFRRPPRHASCGCVGTFAIPAVLVWFARPSNKSMRTSAAGRSGSPVLSLAIVASTLLVAATPASAGLIFATYDSSNTGSLNGVGFTMSGLSNAGNGGDIQSMDMSGSDWNSVGSQQGRIYNSIQAATFNVTFDAPVSNLQMYLYYFRGGTVGGGGYDSYDFGEAFAITGGLGGQITQTGTTLNTATSNFASGVISFSAPVSSLSVTSTGGPANGGDQGFTFAVVQGGSAVPEPSSLAIFAICGCTAGLGYTGRRKRKVAA